MTLLCKMCGGARLRRYVDHFGWLVTCRDCGYRRAITKAEADQLPEGR